MNLFRPLAAHDDPLFSMQPAAASWHLAELHAGPRAAMSGSR